MVRPTPGSSSGGEFHPPALTEPDVKLSPHPALPLQPLALPRTGAPPIAGWPRPAAGVSGPFAPPALPGFIATTSPSVPAPRIGTRLLVGQPLGGLPWHRSAGSRVPHKSLRWAHAASVPATARAACRPSPGLLPGHLSEPWFRWRPFAFDTLPTVHSRSSSQHTPDGFRPAFSRNAHHPGHCSRAASGGLSPDPAFRARGAHPHLSYSRHFVRSPTSLRAFAAHDKLRSSEVDQASSVHPLGRPRALPRCLAEPQRREAAKARSSRMMSASFDRNMYRFAPGSSTILASGMLARKSLCHFVSIARPAR